MGVGMGMTMMPIMSAALKTLRQSDVARASTSLNIIQQVAASIGTALLSVLLFNEVKDKLAPLAANAPAGTPAPDVATTSIADLPEPIRSQLADLMSEAYSSTFVWALVLLAVAFIPALFLPRGKAAAPRAEEPPADALPVGAEAPPVIDEPAR
jgi:uncharacterized membrane protein